MSDNPVAQSQSIQISWPYPSPKHLAIPLKPNSSPGQTTRHKQPPQTPPPTSHYPQSPHLRTQYTAKRYSSASQIPYQRTTNRRRPRNRRRHRQRHRPRSRRRRRQSPIAKPLWDITAVERALFGGCACGLEVPAAWLLKGRCGVALRAEGAGAGGGVADSA
ncbi:hypothetical protein DOTSEDRAFT_75008 [Dothistroma septosporum NZE10]|uniref:Uncharacterized protein n=1 Tax=Dothistroma septosporum (strain NZE10 / CBS 128990) TaxID=675120 RepID=N1PFN0_DOTSN|nr:hypothetical protein DOTSEDRAFT_75008 [Dothistroma septosporum NZE10]